MTGLLGGLSAVIGPCAGYLFSLFKHSAKKSIAGVIYYYTKGIRDYWNKLPVLVVMAFSANIFQGRMEKLCSAVFKIQFLNDSIPAKFLVSQSPKQIFLSAFRYGGCIAAFVF